MTDVSYITVDLEIDSRSDLTSIVEQFGEDAMPLYNGEWGEYFRATFEIPGSHAGANEDIEYFCCLIECLRGEAKKLWDESFSKVFDLGFESGDTFANYHLQLRPDAVKRLGACGATLAVTIYPFKEKP